MIREMGVGGTKRGFYLTIVNIRWTLSPETIL